MSLSWMKHKPDTLQIPPANAKPINENLFRFVTKDTPDASDFLPSCISPKQKHMRSSRGNFPRFHGTSFFITRDAAEKKKLELPQVFENELLASGNIDNNHGVAKCSESGHVTVWFYENTYPQGFTLV